MNRFKPATPPKSLHLYAIAEERVRQCRAMPKDEQLVKIDIPLEERTQKIRLERATIALITPHMDVLNRLIATKQDFDHVLFCCLLLNPSTPQNILETIKSETQTMKDGGVLDAIDESLSLTRSSVSEDRTIAEYHYKKREDLAVTRVYGVKLTRDLDDSVKEFVIYISENSLPNLR